MQLLIGLEHIRAAAARAGARDRRKLEAFIATLEGDDPVDEKIEDLWSEDLLALMWRNAERKFVTRYHTRAADRSRSPARRVQHLVRALPALRRGGGGEARHVPRRRGAAAAHRAAWASTSSTCRRSIRSARRSAKGRTTRCTAEPDDVGSPWAIGGAEGGHKADASASSARIDDFERLVAKAKEHGIEMAMDIAFQASPDHPYVKEHPTWFLMRPDGTIQYAENPPKKYQDIYPFHFESDDWQELWDELRDVFAFWVGKGVRVFRVDNPHTKPLPFWEWCIRDLKREWPDLIFLAEAFTRPKIMYRLAKGGFTQSYTYFAWRNTKQELTEYFEEITQAAGERFLPAERLAEHAGHPHRVSAVRRARRRS